MNLQPQPQQSDHAVPANAAYAQVAIACHAVPKVKHQ